MLESNLCNFSENIVGMASGSSVHGGKPGAVTNNCATSTGVESQCVLLVNPTLDNWPPQDSICKPMFVGSDNMSKVAQHIYDGEILLRRPVVVVYLGAINAHRYDREVTSARVCNLIHAINTICRNVQIYFCCLLPHMIEYVENLHHITRFNSALKWAVLKAHSKWEMFGLWSCKTILYKMGCPS